MANSISIINVGVNRPRKELPAWVVRSLKILRDSGAFLFSFQKRLLKAVIYEKGNTSVPEDIRTSDSQNMELAFFAA